MNSSTEIRWFVDADDNRILADDARRTIICSMSATCRNPEVMRAARLIAAAPELLEALRRLDHFTFNERWAMKGLDDDAQKVHDQVSAAIAKAEGRV